MTVKIFTNPVSYSVDEIYEKSANEILIGVEGGAHAAVISGLELDLVIGDFDSLSKEAKETVINNAKNVVEYPQKKDYTDTYLAVKEALKYTPDEIIIYGGIGNRFDHSFANLLLLKLGPIALMNENHKMYLLDPGKYTIDNSFEFISFFALEDVSGLSLKGFTYPLNDYHLKLDDPLCISNQGSGEVAFDEGLILVIESSDK